MPNRVITFTPNPDDTVGAPLTPPVGFRVYLDSNPSPVINAPNPGSPGSFNLNLNPGPHLIEISQLSNGVEGAKVPINYIEPSGIPGEIDPASVVVT